MQRFDVVIVGAGPAGAFCAYLLARSGARVALVEQAKLPRYKPCGGGVTWKAAHSLPFDIAPVVEREVRGITLSFRAGPARRFDAGGPLCYTVMRDRFDAYLAEQAVAAGALLFDGRAVTAIEVHPAGVQVSARGLSVSAPTLVGADGAKGIVAGTVGLRPASMRFVAMECELQLDRYQDRVPLDTLTLDFVSDAAQDLDYAWVFPKAGLLSVGAAGGERAGGAIKRYFEHYFVAQGFHREDVVRTVGHTLPCRLVPTELVAGRVLLVGDAAGMVEPFTGEGIAYALKSARIAAEVLLEMLDGRLPDLQEYRRRVDVEILPDLRRAYALSRLARRMPRLTYFAFVHVPRFRRLVYALLRGERSFRAPTTKLRPFEPLLRRLEPPVRSPVTMHR